MKSLIVRSLSIFTILSFLCYLYAGTNCLRNGETLQTSMEPLVTSHWHQAGAFSKYTPDQALIGCWGTALAQIAFYHKWQPQGIAAYTTSSGIDINEDLTAFVFDFSQFSTKLDTSTLSLSKDVVAKYNYFAALAFQKDFGTGGYLNLLAPSKLLEAHYPAKVNRYISYQGLFPYTADKMEQIIIKELNNRRPVFLHFADLETFGHSVVVDAYRIKDNQIEMHINNGQGGEGDDWYLYKKDILRSGDSILRVIYTLENS